MKLANLITQVRGVSYKTSNIKNVNDGIPILRANNINDNNINFNDLIYIDKTKISEKKYLKVGDILICTSSGSKELVGKAAELKNVFSSISFGAFCKVIRINDDNNINKDYIRLFFKSKIYRKQISKLSNGANINNIKTEDINNLIINIPEIVIQNNAVKEMNNIFNAIEYKKKELINFDELIKSRFNELFMHRVLPKVRLIDVSIAKGEYGACSASVEYNPNRPRYVRITDINDDGTLNVDFVSSKVLTDDNEYKLSYGDFLFARMGATVGKTYAFYSGNQIYAGYLIRYKLDLNRINPRYLYWYTKQNEYWGWVKLKQSGAAQPGINAKKYDSLEIPLASIEEQNEFACPVVPT